MEVVATQLTTKSPVRAHELFTRFAAALKQQPGSAFTELRVIALLNLSRVQERLGHARECGETRQMALSLFDGIGRPGDAANIQDMLAEVLIERGEYRRAIKVCEQALKL